MADPKPVPGLHLVKTTDPAEDSLASDVVDILQASVRGSPDCDVGGVEEDYVTTREADEAKQTEAEFFRAVADKLKSRVGDWANGRRGVAFGELGTRDGWRLGLYDFDGRLFEVELRWSEIAGIAAQQRAGTISNFEQILDRVVAKFQEQRRVYFSRMGGYALQ